jgi:hypothetical protein
MGQYMELSGQLHSPARLPLGKETLAGWMPGPVWMLWRKENFECDI